jgi:hypothetical protein
MESKVTEYQDKAKREANTLVKLIPEKVVMHKVEYQPKDERIGYVESSFINDSVF